MTATLSTPCPQHVEMFGLLKPLCSGVQAARALCSQRRGTYLSPGLRERGAARTAPSQPGKGPVGKQSAGSRSGAG